jgi:DNA-binding transcriptional LysR family regulator
MINPPGMLTSNNLSAIVTAAICGAAICYVPNHYAALPIASGKLVQMLEDFSPALTAIVFIIHFLGNRHGRSAPSSSTFEMVAVPEKTRTHSQAARRHEIFRDTVDNGDRRTNDMDQANATLHSLNGM